MTGSIRLAGVAGRGCPDEAPPLLSRLLHPDGVGLCWFRFPPEVILLAVRWYLRFGLSYRDSRSSLAERGIEVDHVTLFRWVQRFTPVLIDSARPCRHVVGDRWFVDETYVKVAGHWRYVYRAVDQYGQVIDVLPRLQEARHPGGRHGSSPKAFDATGETGRGHD